MLVNEIYNFYSCMKIHLKDSFAWANNSIKLEILARKGNVSKTIFNFHHHCQQAVEAWVLLRAWP